MCQKIPLFMFSCITGDELIILNSMHILEQLETLRYSFQLIRLGSQILEDEEEYPPSRSSVPVSVVANSHHDGSGKGSRNSSISSNSHVIYDSQRLSNEMTKGFVVTAEVHDLEVDSETDCGKKKLLKNHWTNCTVCYI